MLIGCMFQTKIEHRSKHLKSVNLFEKAINSIIDTSESLN